MTVPVLEARELQYSYPDGTSALRGLTLQVYQGQKVAVLGPNGAGKSTLFLHLNGILRPRDGRVLLHGREVDYSRRGLLDLRRNVGIVFQDPDSQLFSASVMQDVSFGPVNLGLSGEEALARAERAMQDTGLAGLENKPTHFLSYGQKKRASIAGVLAMDPAVIVFDEPTACLDPGMARKMMELLDGLSRQGKSIVMSTHDVDLAYQWADYIYLLDQGTVAGQGHPGEIFLRRDLLARCDLACPWVVETFLELAAAGLVPANAPVPGNREELFSLIHGAAPAAGIRLKSVRHG